MAQQISNGTSNVKLIKELASIDPILEKITEVEHEQIIEMNKKWTL
jgi:hypothetical protein